MSKSPEFPAKDWGLTPKERMAGVKDEMIKKEEVLKEKERMGEAISIAAKGEVVARFIEKYPDQAKDKIMPFFERSIDNADNNNIWVDNNNIWVDSELREGPIGPDWKEKWLKEDIESAYNEIRNILDQDDLSALEKGK